MKNKGNTTSPAERLPTACCLPPTRFPLPSAFTLHPASFLKRFHDNDQGQAAVSFILVFPIFLWIVAILVQFALLMNAKVMVDNAAAVAARAAVTSLPEGKPQNVSTAAYMALAPLSPKSTSAASSESETIYEALQNTGVAVAPSFPNRYTYAQEATTVSWDPQIDYTTARARTLTVNLKYRFYLTVPGAKMLIGSADNIAGVDGRFLDIASATATVETSHARAAQ